MICINFLFHKKNSVASVLQCVFSVQPVALNSFAKMTMTENCYNDYKVPLQTHSIDCRTT